MAALALLAFAWPDLSRAGYSPDEEFTIFAVRGITTHGLPLLPSNLLYDRGLAYSYASWMAGAVAGGESLPAYRLVSFLGALLGAALLAGHVARLRGRWAGALCAVLVIGSIPFWVSASTARFYGPLLLFYVAALVVMTRAPGHPGTPHLGTPHLGTRAPGHLGTLFAAAILARWCHELAFTLALVPAAGFLLARGRRREWFVRGIVVGAALLVAQATLVYVNRLAPTSGDTMVERFFLWQALNLFERPALGLGIPLTIAVCVTLVQPHRARFVTTIALVLTLMGASFMATMLIASGAPPAAAAHALGSRFSAYPLDLFAYLVQTTPLLVLAALSSFALRASGRGGEWPAEERAVHALWIGWVLWFGVIESGVTARYLLLPVTFMLAAIAVDVVAIVTVADGRTRRVAGTGALLAVVLAAESWYGLPFSPGPRLADARPTMALVDLSGEIAERDVVACTDELACQLLANRIDAWLVLDDFFRERFIVMRDGRPHGVYTGVDAADEIQPLLQRAERQDGRLLIIDVTKDVPGFGMNVGLVERALAREGLEARLVTAVPHVRLMEVGSKPMIAQRVRMPGDWSTKPSR